MLDFFSLRSDFDSGLFSLETLFSGPVIFDSDFSLVVFSDDDLSVFVDSASFVDFFDGDFSESSETFFDFSARSDDAFSDNFSVDLETGLDTFSVDLFDDFSDGFSDILSEDLSDDFTGVDDIGLFESSGFELFKIDFIVGLGFDGTDSTFSFSVVFDLTELLSGFFGESVLSDFLSAGFVTGSLFSDFSFLSLSFVTGVFAGSGIGS